MTEITINLDQYNLLFEKAMSFDKIVEAVKNNIDKNDIYPVDSDEILLLTGLTKYQHDRIQMMANSAEAKMNKTMRDQIETISAENTLLKEKIEELTVQLEATRQPEPQPEEEENHAEDQTEL